jgi:uncharacterized protein (DUF885 family)
MTRRSLLPLLLAIAGCRHAPAPGDAPAPSATAAADGVTHPGFAALLEDHWAYTLRRYPTWATELGERRYDDQIFDPSVAAREAGQAKARALLAAAKALDPAAMSPREAIFLALFIEELEAGIADEVCRFEDWSLSPRSNPVTEWSYLTELHPLTTPADGERLLARFEKAAWAIDTELENLRRGAQAGWFSNQESTRRVLKMAQDLLQKPVAEWAMAKPAAEPPASWPSEDRARFSAALLKVLTEAVKPALARYATFVEQELLPHSRDEAHSGVGALPFGQACYQARVQAFTTLKDGAEVHHQLGLAEIARINQEMAALGKKLFGAKDLADTLARLRTDGTLYFDSAASLEAKAESALAKARAAIPGYFGILPKAQCVVSRIPDYEAPFTTIAYYRQPAPDGSKPGEYFINLYEPQTRPRFELEALTYHESIPGHHLQIAIAQELPAVPAFLKHGGMTVFVEGWALYTEQLADEMGLYEGDLDRMGMLSFEAWRASRLVVDTGLHAMGWSRAQAKQFMLEHTALAPNNIDNEVDRYIVWPGQALAYKTGQMEIWRLRRAAEAALGERFDLKAFHDTVLGQGAVSLPVLRAQVEAWVARTREAAGARP